MEQCECKHAKPSMKVSENGIITYCLKCKKDYKPKTKHNE